MMLPLWGHFPSFSPRQAPGQSSGLAERHTKTDRQSDRQTHTDECTHSVSCPLGQLGVSLSLLLELTFKNNHFIGRNPRHGGICLPWCVPRQVFTRAGDWCPHDGRAFWVCCKGRPGKQPACLSVMCSPRPRPSRLTRGPARRDPQCMSAGCVSLSPPAVSASPASRVAV